MKRFRKFAKRSNAKDNNFGGREELSATSPNFARFSSLESDDLPSTISKVYKSEENLLEKDVGGSKSSLTMSEKDVRTPPTPPPERNKPSSVLLAKGKAPAIPTLDMDTMDDAQDSTDHSVAPATPDIAPATPAKQNVFNKKPSSPVSPKPAMWSHLVSHQSSPPASPKASEVDYTDVINEQFSWLREEVVTDREDNVDSAPSVKPKSLPKPLQSQTSYTLEMKESEDIVSPLSSETKGVRGRGKHSLAHFQ